jgi:asparagine synthase (glutamine-hydrolysing)
VSGAPPSAGATSLPDAAPRTTPTARTGAILGGVLAWRPSDPGSTIGTLHAMAKASAASACVVVDQEPFVGLFTDAREAVTPGDRPIAVVADADLTNLSELQRSAGPLPSVSTLIAALYRQEGLSFLRRLQGAFVIALWDSRERSLMLAVDRFGMRRLHYARTADGIVFATRPSVVLAAPASDARVQVTTVYTYLNFGYVPAPRSIFAAIARLEPGHYVVERAARHTVTRYWDMQYAERPLPEGPAAQALYAKTHEAVHASLQTVTPGRAGTFLSGGTDSSVVLGLARRITGPGFNAFSIGFAEDAYNELGYAGLAARQFDATHHTHIVGPTEALTLLPALVEAHDEPYGNNSAIATLACLQLARERGIDVLLAGDGGDEIFGGNERYRIDGIFAVYHRLPPGLRRWVLEPVLGALPESGVLGRAQRYVRRANIPNPARFYSYEFFFTREGHELLAPDFRAAVERDAPITLLTRLYAQVGAAAELNRLLYLDLKLTIGDNDLLKVTRAADVAGVGVRFPLLHPPLVEFMGTLSPRYKVRRLEKRFLFKRAFGQLLPTEILAKRKHGFGVPTSLWLRTDPGFRELARDTLLSRRSRERGYFRRGAIERLFESHATDTTPYYGDILWTVLMLELWHGRHADTTRPA